MLHTIPTLVSTNHPWSRHHPKLTGEETEPLNKKIKWKNWDQNLGVVGSPGFPLCLATILGYQYNEIKMNRSEMKSVRNGCNEWWESDLVLLSQQEGKKGTPPTAPQMHIWPMVKHFYERKKWITNVIYFKISQQNTLENVQGTTN